jgi:hypothetical protein
MNKLINILLENSSSFLERNTIYALSENDQAMVNTSLINKLYNVTLQKAHVDFEDIPNSKGDISKYSGYKSILETLDIIKGLAKSSNVKINEVDIIEDAVNNIVVHRDLFFKGFKLEKDFVILLYNSLVAACVEATSLLISSYIDFIKRPDKVEFNLIKLSMGPNALTLDNLASFNASVKSGDFSKVLNYVITTGKQNFLGPDIIAALVIGGLVLIIPILRELIFYFYYTRMKLSDYMKQQSMLLELNKNMIQSNTALTPNQKKEILTKQIDRINFLNNISDKIKVDNTMTQSKSIDDIKNENKSWSLDSITPSSSATVGTGVQLL